MYKEKTVAVVVPAYNEEGFVGEVIDTIPEYVDRVYVIDDESTDNTWKEIRKHAKKVNNEHELNEELREKYGFEQKVVPIKHSKNKGVGGAIKTGYLLASEDEIDVTAVMGGDGQMDPDNLHMLLDPIVEGEADYAKGNRLIHYKYRKDMSRWRFFGNAVLTFLTKIASGYWKTMDPQNGYTAISKYALENVGIKSMWEGYGYCNDLLVRLNTKDMKVADVSMEAIYGEEGSHIRYRSYLFNVSWMLAKDFFWRLKTKYLLLDFNPLALFYVVGSGLAGLGVILAFWALYLWFFQNTPLFMRGTLSLLVFMMGSMFVMFAMLFDMQANKDKEMKVHE
ncbi:MAG: glycosyltransferase family 2 protein [Thermoplasmatota archaeon]